MALLTSAFTIILILVNLIGLALACQRATGNYALARVASPAVAALAMFFCEHFVGFGRLGWCWPITTAVAGGLIFRRRALLLRQWRVEAVFLAAFEWAFLWRLSFPGIVGSSEKIGDLAMIASYLPGHRLPPPDAWFPPYPFDVYYSFQHYAAALLGRIFDLGPGLTYNLAFCLLTALTMTAAAWFVYTVCRSAPRSALVVLAFAAGGTGATLPVHLMMKSPHLHSSMRFIGGSATPERVDTSIGTALVGAPVDNAPRPMELPSETFAYLLSLGDYHPPLSGFYLLTLGLLCIGLIESGAATRASHAVLAATPMICTIANGWSLPMQGALVLAWIAYRVRERRSVDWAMLAVGFVATATLCYPFLASFAYRSADYAVRLKPVRQGEHMPWLLGAILLYPVVVVSVLSMVFSERRKWVVWVSLLWLGLLLFSELFYIDDVYSGPFNRFNTTLKWWPWIQAGALLTAGAYAAASRSRTLRYGLIAVLSAVSFYSVDLVRHLVFVPKVDFGRLDGAAWVTSDVVERALLEFLKSQPPGIVLQRLEAGAFTPAPGLVLFAGQTAFLGWPAHEKLWRGQRVDIDLREKAVGAFYAGEMPDAARWLLQNRIDHVLWLKTEAKQPAAAFEQINHSLRPAYFWREYYRADDFRVGVWSRSVPFDAVLPPEAAPPPAP